MSRMFEALRKTEGELAEVAKAVLADESVGKEVMSLGSGSELSSAATEPTDALMEASPTISNVGSYEVRSESIEVPLDSPMLPFDGSDDQAAEQYKIIRTKIRHHRSQPRIVLVSSPMPGDGKTISSVNLAAALSLEENARVLLMDCDFRRSSATRLLGLTATPGLGEVLRNEASLESSLIRVSQFPNFYLLPPGTTSPGPAELLSTVRWQSLLETVRSEFRFVIVDAPPIGAVAEYELLQLACDGVVLVVRQDHTNRQLWQKALEAVPKSKQLGVILNCARSWFLWKTHGYYYYSAGSR